MQPYFVLMALLLITCIMSNLAGIDYIARRRAGEALNAHRYLTKITKGKILFVGICVFLIIFSGIRYYVGTDYWAYIEAYNKQIAGTFYNWHFEFGFLTLMKVVAFFKVNYVFYFMVIAFVTIIPISEAIKKRSPYPIYSITLFVLFYFFCASFNTPRQYIAIAIVLWSSKYIFEHKFWKYLMWVLIASSFHSSAIACVGLFFAGKIKISNQSKIAMAIFAIVMFLFGDRITTFFLGMWPQYSSYIGYSSGSAISDLIIQVALLFMLESVRNNINGTDKNEFDFYYICTFVAIIMSTMTNVNVLFARLGAYFYIFSILAVPYGIYYAKRNKRLWFAFFLLLGSIVFVRYILANNCGVVPYKISPLLR